MTIFALITAGVILLLATIQLALSVYFYIKFTQLPSDRMPRVAQEMASVLVAVRGCDPSLEECIRGLLEQDYEQYEIHVVVDSEGGQAWQLLQRVKAEFDLQNRLNVHPLTTPLTTCGLKCSALVQAIGEVSLNSRYLALLDADICPHPSWLAEVTGPLLNPDVGVVTGGQWFEADGGGSVGSLLRSLWGAGALVPTVLFQNPWAGSFAMRMEDFHDSELRQMWSNTVIDDGPIRSAIQPTGMEIVVAPSLLMVNREQCTFNYVGKYVTRMLTWSRLFEKTFWTTALIAIGMLGLIGGVVASVVAACLNAISLQVIAVVIAASLTGMLMSVVAYVIVRNAVRFSCHLRGETVPAMKLVQIFKLEFLVPIVMLVFGISCFRALFTTTIEWRKVVYEVNSKYDVRVLEYQPWDDNEDIKVSI